MPERFEEALQVTAVVIGRHGSAAGHAVHRQVAAMAKSVASWCERLEASAVLPSLDHNDLHPWNILGNGASDTRFYDWGDSVVAHPFAAMVVPLGFVQRLLEAGLDGRRFLCARDAYLEVFGPIAPNEDLVAALEVACRVAKVARVLTWDRALQTAREQGEGIADLGDRTPESLASPLDESYLGGA